jgi:hypothetical protein
VGRLLGALALVLVTVAGAPAAHASSTICVALVVDDGDLGGGVHSTCASVPKGATGYDVLHAGGHSFTICSNGVLGTIDGKPADGCHALDSSHYWSYWHRAPGSSTWTYSDEGAGTYQPRNASTEGWVWQNGRSQQPTAVPYSRICTATSAPRPTQQASTPASTATTTRAPTATTTTAAASEQSTRAAATRRTTSSAASSSAPLPTASTSAPSTTPPTTSAPSARVAAESKPDSPSGGPPVALIVAMGAVVLVTAAAVVRQRRSR